MIISLDDLSPAALETLAELIEQRLENDTFRQEPITWHQAQARQNAARELSQTLCDAGHTRFPTQIDPTDNASATLH